MVCHASRAFALGPSLGLGFSTSWGDGTMEQWKQAHSANALLFQEFVKASSRSSLEGFS